MPAPQDELGAEMLDMEDFWQFLYCLTALDGCHIPVNFPHEGWKPGRNVIVLKAFAPLL